LPPDATLDRRVATRKTLPIRTIFWSLAAGVVRVKSSARNHNSSKMDIRPARMTPLGASFTPLSGSKR
jgi:hypothetical protein